MFWKPGHSVVIAAYTSKRRMFWFESTGMIASSAYFAITFISQRNILRLGRFLFFLLSTAPCQLPEFVMLLYADRLERIGFGLCLVFTTNKNCPICIPYNEYVSDLKKHPSRQFSSSNGTAVCAPDCLKFQPDVGPSGWALCSVNPQSFSCHAAVQAPLSKVSLIK